MTPQGWLKVRRWVRTQKFRLAGDALYWELPRLVYWIWTGVNGHKRSKAEDREKEKQTRKSWFKATPKYLPSVQWLRSRRSLNAFLAAVNCSVARSTIPSIILFRWSISFDFFSDISNNSSFDLISSMIDCKWVELSVKSRPTCPIKPCCLLITFRKLAISFSRFSSLWRCRRPTWPGGNGGNS